MLYCPRCQSPNIVSGKLDDIILTRAMQMAHAVHNFQNRRLTRKIHPGWIFSAKLTA